jgi:hypothetical protein
MGQSHRLTPLQQRLEIWERAQQGQSDATIAAALQLSAVTVRKWRRRAAKHGRSGLATTLGRPTRGPLSHCAEALRGRVRQLRRSHPGWGPETLRLELAADPHLAGQALPSRASLAAFLKAEGLTRRYERHAILSQPPVAPPSAAHEEWQLDAQGVRRVAGAGCVTVINIGDPYTHLRVGSQACLARRKAATADYQLALRRAFLRYGLPQRLSLDHDTTFYDSLSASPFPTQLHLWLLALGIDVHFIHLARPTEHGFIERTHQLLDQQALQGQTFAQPEDVQPRLDRRRQFLNTRYPSRSLGGQPPLTAYPQAGHSGRPYTPAQEAELLNLHRVYDYLAANRWFRHVTTGGQFSLGSQRYGLGKAWARQDIEIGFDPQTQELICTAADGQRSQRRAITGLTKADLMGDLALAQFLDVLVEDAEDAEYLLYLETDRYDFMRLW